jgi:murein DD-endopeptidase MepM/ murein hydrolase activator NlpD
MERIFLFVAVICSLLATAISASAESQTWTVRAGDNLDMIASTLEIPKQEIKKLNPGISESNLQISQKIELPFRDYAESKAIDEELGRREQRIRELEGKNSDLENSVIEAESQLRWHPIWLWGFWACFGALAFIFGGAYWIFRETHPRVFEPHDRSLTDLRESQLRLRTGFAQEYDTGNDRDQWRPSFDRLHAHR